MIIVFLMISIMKIYIIKKSEINRNTKRPLFGSKNAVHFLNIQEKLELNEGFIFMRINSTDICMFFTLNLDLCDTIYKQIIK